MNVSKLFLGILPIALITATATSADAVSRHEKVEVKEMKSGGEVVGMRVKLTLRPDGSGYQHVRIGLGPKGGDKSNDFRQKASDPGKGHLLHQFPEVKDIKNNEPKEMTFEVKYADVSNLKPGQEFEVISAWGGNPNNKDYYHVYGMTSTLASGDAYKAPGKPQAQQQQLAKRTRAPKKATRTSPKQKTSTLATRLKANTAKTTSRKQGSTLTTKSNAKAPAKAKSSTRLAQGKTAAKAAAKSSRGLSPAKVKSQSRSQAAKPARAAKVKQAKAARAKKVKAKSKAR